jgi:hypothetical protein
MHEWLIHFQHSGQRLCVSGSREAHVGSAASGHPNRTHLVWQTLSLTAVKLKVGTHGRVVAFVVGVSAFIKHRAESNVH